MKHFSEIPEIITSLNFDGDKEDKRLHLEYDVRWCEIDEQEYKNVEREIDNYCIKRENYLVYAWCDVSGWDYWMNRQEEENYIQISVSFSKDELSDEEIQQLASDIETAETWANNFESYLKEE